MAEQPKGWNEERAFEDWTKANGIIEAALAEWFGSVLNKCRGFGPAIQARLAKEGLFVVRQDVVKYEGKSA